MNKDKPSGLYATSLHAQYTPTQETSYANRTSAQKVLRNTYWLLAMTLAFSAVTAFAGMAAGIKMNIFVFFIGAYGLMFLTHKLSNSAWGLVSTFAFTGFMGLALAPILSMYIGAGAGDLVVTAFAMTAFVFLGLSAVVLITRKDFSFLNGFIMAGALVLLAAIVVNLFVGASGLALAISAGFVLFASAIILYETSAIIHGGQDNYILATISLYMAIYNLFISLLQLLGLAADD